MDRYSLATQTFWVPWNTAEFQEAYLKCCDCVEWNPNHLGTRQTLSQIQIFSNAGRRIRQSLDLQTVLSTAANEFQCLLEADRVLICTQQPLPDGRLIVAEAIELSLFLADPSHLITSYRLLEELRESSSPESDKRMPVVVNNLGKTLNGNDHSDLNETRIHSCLRIPIYLEDQWWGDVLAHHCSSPKRWDVYPPELLKQLAADLGIAIQHSLQFQSVQQEQQKLHSILDRQLVDLTRRLQHQQRLQTLLTYTRLKSGEGSFLQFAVKELSEDLSLIEGGIAFFESTRLTYSVRCTYPRQYLMKDHLDPIIYQQLAQNLSVCYITRHSLLGICSILACPLFAGDKLIGFLQLIREREDLFEETDIQFAEDVANQCSSEIFQAQMQQSLNRLPQSTVTTDPSVIQHLCQRFRGSLSNMKMAMVMIEKFGINEQQQRYLNVFKSEFDHEVELIQKITQLQALESPECPLNLRAAQPKEWILEFLKPFQHQCVSQRFHLDIRLKTLPDSLTTDYNLLSQLLSELLANAQKFTPPGEYIQVSAQQIETGIHIEVINTGVDLSPEELPHLFEKFYRASNVMQFEPKGHGLGLTIVKTIVKRLNGSVRVESQLQTTQVIVELPFVHKCSEWHPDY